MLRALGRSGRTTDLLLAEPSGSRGLDADFDGAFERLAAALAPARLAAVGEAGARGLVRQIVTLVQASLLLRAGSQAMAEGFCATRLAPDAGWGATFGDATGRIDARAIVDRAFAG